MKTVILLSFLFVAMGYPRTHQQSKPNEETDKGDHIPPPAVIAPSSPAPGSNPSTPEIQTSADNKAKSYFERAFAPEYLSNWVLVVAAIGGIFVGLRTLRAVRRQTGKMAGQLRTMQSQLGVMERQTTATETAANATQESVKLAAKSTFAEMNENRPRVSIEPEEPRLDWKSVSSIPYKIDFWCPTFCFVEDAQIEAYLFSGVLDKIPEYVPINPESPVRETKKVQMYAVIFHSPTKEQIEAVRRNELRLFLRGFIKYRGVHLSPEEPSYKTPFRRRWVNSLITNPIPGLNDGYWEEYGEPEENQPT